MSYRGASTLTFRELWEEAVPSTKVYEWNGIELGRKIGQEETKRENTFYKILFEKGTVINANPAPFRMVWGIPLSKENQFFDDDATYHGMRRVGDTYQRADIPILVQDSN